jgi:hypothetical protein
MNSARIERMTRELNAEPAAQFFASLIKLFARYSPTVSAPAKAGLSSKPRHSF